MNDKLKEDIAGILGGALGFLIGYTGGYCWAYVVYVLWRTLR